MAAVYNGDSGVHHASAGYDVINNEEVLPKHHDVTTTPAHHDEVSTIKENVHIDKHDKLKDIHDINDNNELHTSVVSEETPANITESNNEIVSKQINTLELSHHNDEPNHQDEIDNDNHEISKEELGVKTDNIKLAANFQTVSVADPVEMGLSSATSEETACKDVTDATCDDFASTIAPSESMSSSVESSLNVCDTNEETSLNEDSLSAVKMNESHINTIDNIALSESYVKITVDNDKVESENVHCDSTVSITADPLVTSNDLRHDSSKEELTIAIDLSHDLHTSQENEEDTVPLHEDIAVVDSSIESSKELEACHDSSKDELPVAIDLIHDLHTSQKNEEDTVPLHEDIAVVDASIESSKELGISETCHDSSKEELPVAVDLIHDLHTNKKDEEDTLPLHKDIPVVGISETAVTDFVSDVIEFAKSQHASTEEVTSDVENTAESHSVPQLSQDELKKVPIIDLTEESSNSDSTPVEIIDLTCNEDIGKDKTNPIQITDDSAAITEIVEEANLKNEEFDPVEIIDLPAQIVETSTHVENVADCAVKALDNEKCDDQVNVETSAEPKADVEVIDCKTDSPLVDVDATVLPGGTVKDAETDSKIDADLSDEVITSSDTPEVEWMDILGNGLLKKKVIVKGKGRETRPASGSTVKVRCEGKLEDGTIVDKHDCLEFILSDEDVIQAFDLAVALMEDKETAMIITDPRYAYGIHGRRDFIPRIPQNATITYEVEILSIEEGPVLATMSSKERCVRGDKKRIRGNDLYSREEYPASISAYKRGVKYLEGSGDKEVMDLKIKCLNNLSAAQLKVKAYDMAIKSLDTVLQFEPENVKALFRKGKCLEGMNKEEEALECIKKASMLDPQNKSIQQDLRKLTSRVAVTHQKEKEMYKKMFKNENGEKISPEEEQLNWSVKVTTGVVGLLGMFLGYLWYTKR